MRFRSYLEVIVEVIKLLRKEALQRVGTHFMSNTLFSSQAWMFSRPLNKGIACAELAIRFLTSFSLAQTSPASNFKTSVFTHKQH
jgi:hypothetical protein